MTARDAKRQLKRTRLDVAEKIVGLIGSIAVLVLLILYLSDTGRVW